MSQKIGFWAVFALVIGSQIGSGVFMLPASLAPYGMLGLCGWLISGAGAIALALVFAKLCEWFPKTGGPHVYVHEAFGTTASFFTGWTYWVISWVSSTVLVSASVGYLTPLIGMRAPAVNLVLELAVLGSITALNFRGVMAAGRAEFFLTILKFIPLVVVPLGALAYFDSGNFALQASASEYSILHILSRVTLLTLWGFIGLESATAPAGSVANPSKTIPHAVVAGTICVALLYIINSIGIMGVVPASQLMQSNAPYADAVQVMLGGNWHLIISVIASIICIGTLNAWTLTSSQIALGLAQDGLMPALFARKNKFDAPYIGLITSSIGICPLLILTANQSLAGQVFTIIDFSVTAFLFVYALCTLTCITILLRRKEYSWNMARTLIYSVIALIFCMWVIYETPLKTLAIASLFTFCGIPLYLWFRCSKKQHKYI